MVPYSTWPFRGVSCAVRWGSLHEEEDEDGDDGAGDGGDVRRRDASRSAAPITPPPGTPRAAPTGMATLKMVRTRLRWSSAKKSASMAGAKMPKLASPMPSMAWRKLSEA